MATKRKPVRKKVVKRFYLWDDGCERWLGDDVGEYGESNVDGFASAEAAAKWLEGNESDCCDGPIQVMEIVGIVAVKKSVSLEPFKG